MSAKDAKEEPREEFLSRWSRRKHEARQAETLPEKKAPDSAAPAPGERDGPAPELPPLDSLTFDSDYRDFLHPKVDEGVRRAALKKLFSDPHFNVMDGLDVYIDDYSKSEPIPPAMLAGLVQAQKILQWAKEDEEQRKKDEAEKAALATSPALQPAAAPAPREIGYEEGISSAAPAPGDPGERAGS